MPSCFCLLAFLNVNVFLLICQTNKIKSKLQNSPQFCWRTYTIDQLIKELVIESRDVPLYHCLRLAAEGSRSCTTSRWELACRRLDISTWPPPPRPNVCDPAEAGSRVLLQTCNIPHYNVLNLLILTNNPNHGLLENLFPVKLKCFIQQRCILNISKKLNRNKTDVLL